MRRRRHQRQQQQDRDEIVEASSLLQQQRDAEAEQQFEPTVRAGIEQRHLQRVPEFRVGEEVDVVVEPDEAACVARLVQPVALAANNTTAVRNGIRMPMQTSRAGRLSR